MLFWLLGNMNYAEIMSIGRDKFCDKKNMRKYGTINKLKKNAQETKLNY